MLLNLLRGVNLLSFLIMRKKEVRISTSLKILDTHQESLVRRSQLLSIGMDVSYRKSPLKIFLKPIGQDLLKNLFGKR